MERTYAEVLKGFLFSMHSRRFIAACISSAMTWVGWKYSIPAEVLAMMNAPIVAFIFGESYQGGKEAEARGKVPETVNVATTGDVQAAPQASQLTADTVPYADRPERSPGMPLLDDEYDFEPQGDVIVDKEAAG